MRRSVTFILIIILCGVAALDVHGATIRVPADWPTIALGINAAMTSDTVIVADGIYHESLIISKSLVLQSENGPVNCVIRPPAGSSEGMLLSANNVTINGFTIDRSPGRGIRVN